jgi:hypothetical protein
MRVEIVEDYEGKDSVFAFPPSEDYSNLREDPRSVERIAVARKHLPL